MTFTEFCISCKENVKMNLPEQFDNAMVELHTVPKNNNVEKVALLIKENESNISPTLYLNDHFEAYQNGYSMEDISKEIVSIYSKAMKDKDNIYLSDISNFESVKERIGMKLVNTKMNEKLLSVSPNIKKEDLSAVFIVHFPVLENDASATALINNDLMNSWGVDKHTLFELAQENVLRDNPPLLTSMEDTMMAIMFEKEPPNRLNDATLDTTEMYVLSNKTKVNGAAIMIYPQIMSNIQKQLGTDYYILPSSIHECLILSKNGPMTAKELQNMVQEVNANEVDKMEFLSNNVYEFQASKDNWKQATHDKELSKDMER